MASVKAMDKELVLKLKEAWRIMGETDYLSDTENGGSGNVYHPPKELLDAISKLENSDDTGKDGTKASPELKDENEEKGEQSGEVFPNVLKKEIKEDDSSDSDLMVTIKEENKGINYQSECSFKSEHVQDDCCPSLSTIKKIKKEKQEDHLSVSFPFEYLKVEKQEEKYQSASNMHEIIKVKTEEDDNQCDLLKYNSLKEEKEDDISDSSSESGGVGEAEEFACNPSRNEETVELAEESTQCDDFQSLHLMEEQGPSGLSSTPTIRHLQENLSDDSVEESTSGDSTQHIGELSYPAVQQFSPDGRVLSTSTECSRMRTNSIAVMCSQSLQKGEGVMERTKAVALNMGDSMGELILKEEQRKLQGVKSSKLSRFRSAFHSRSNVTGYIDCPSKQRCFKCSLCGKSFTQKCHLSTPLRTHTGVRPFKCEECGKSFSVKCSLSRHMRTHTGERPFKCDVCGKSFSESGHLKSHILTHTGERPFQCTMCGISFTQRSHLKTHIRTHTGERPFKCGTCGKSFILRSALITHIRQHTGERPFKCDECGKSYVDSSGLKYHIQTHTGGRRFKCLKCGKKYCTSGYLKTHMCTHT